MKCSQCKVYPVRKDDSDLARVKSILKGYKPTLCSTCYIVENFDPKEFMNRFDETIQTIKNSVKGVEQDIKEIYEQERKAK